MANINIGGPESVELLHEKKQLREFSTAVKGILCTRLIYLRLKTTDFWATYDINLNPSPNTN